MPLGFNDMSSKCKTAISARPTFALDTSSLMKLHKEQNNLVVYTVLTFVIVLLLYLGTKDWKGVTSPEEVDLGSLVPPQPPTPHHRRKPLHVLRRRQHREHED